MRCRFLLTLTAEQCLKYYSGQASTVLVRTTGGKTLSFPAANLRPFITKEGVTGEFEITFDTRNKLKSLRKLNSAA